LRQDYIAEAVHLSIAMKKPVKVLWTRPEEFIQDYFRPASYNKLEAGLNASGAPIAWRHRMVSSSILSWYLETPTVVPDIRDTVDPFAVEGATEVPYNIGDVQVEWVQDEPGVPVSFWRSVGYSFNTWIFESFLDECAHAAGQDPLKYRLALVKDDATKRALQFVAEKSGWYGPKLPKGQGRGIAVSTCFGTTIAQVAEVVIDEDGYLKVRRVVAAVDCGIVINPYLVETQLHSAIIQGLSACLKQQITFKGGAIEQKSFSECGLLAFDETPIIEVHLIPSPRPSSGIGEPGVPPLAPAVCNAIFAATGQRIRSLPISLGS
jgi:CO/xanthine dehydrogenase Mo-binding subunit